MRNRLLFLLCLGACQSQEPSDGVGAIAAVSSSSSSTSEGPATSIAFGTAPSGAAEFAFLPTFTVAVKDANGNTVSSSSATITISLHSGPVGGNIYGELSKAASSGVATFSYIATNKTGTYSVTASVAGLSSIQSGNFSVTEASLETTGLVLNLDAADTSANTGAQFAEGGCNGATPTSWIDLASNLTGTLLQFPANSVACAATGWNASPYRVTFDGNTTSSSTDYVLLGSATQLDLPVYSLFTWFRRLAAGANTSTGTGGITSIEPLITRGIGEAENTQCDVNYSLGINTAVAADPYLGHDFEMQRGVGGCTDSGNVPLTGTTEIQTNTWYQGAVTFDYTAGSNQRHLLLNGKVDATGNGGNNACKPASDDAPLVSQVNKAVVAIGAARLSGSGAGGSGAGACNAATTVSGGFEGDIPLVLVYNRKLSTSEVRKNCYARDNRFGLGCLPSLSQTTVALASGTIAAAATTTLTVTAKDTGGGTLGAGSGNGSTVACVYSGGNAVATLGATTDNGDGTYSITVTGVAAGSGTIICRIDGGLITTSTPTLTVN